MPARLRHWHSQTSSVCSEMTGQWSDRSAMSGTRNCHHQIHWATCATWHWGSGPHSEGEKTPMVWTCGTTSAVVQSRQPLTYRLMKSVGLGGPRWHGNSWQRGIAESGSFRLSTLMKNVPGDLVWDLPCVQQASYLEGGPLIWMLTFLYITKENKTQTLFSVSFILLHFIAYMTKYSPVSLLFTSIYITLPLQVFPTPKHNTSWPSVCLCIY